MKKERCTNCQKKAVIVVSATLKGNPFQLCQKCTDDFRKQTEEVARAFGVKLELEHPTTKPKA
jgi:hypothetical protein